MRRVPAEALDHLKPEQTVCLATTDGEKPYVRPIFLLVLDGSQFMATGMSCAKMAQLELNHNIEWCLVITGESNNGYLRGLGTAALVTDEIIRANVHERFGFIKEYFAQPDDPEFMLLQFHIDEYEFMRPGDDAGTRYKA
ncbi:MAG: pyridoxamine 5'-phosphate oxidase family protein [Candidatus Cloacimonetes bacterium]|nr:pyridoxamine 5'-phosphate oxidase family protein [Candidatus Cloacimonadota bacterium]